MGYLFRGGGDQLAGGIAAMPRGATRITLE
jgi:hypothetical protein